jgi:hypothetical protein
LLFDQEAEFKPDAAKQAAALKLILADPVAAGSTSRAMAGESWRWLPCCSRSAPRKAARRRGSKTWWCIRNTGARAPEKRCSLTVVSQARAEGVLRITLLTDMQNERAQALYRRAGFVGSPMRPMRLKLKKG